MEMFSPKAIPVDEPIAIDSEDDTKLVGVSKLLTFLISGRSNHSFSYTEKVHEPICLKF